MISRLQPIATIERPIFVGLIVVCGLISSERSLHADVLSLPENAEVDAAVRQEAMPEDLGDSEVARILERYYEVGLGGPEAWAELESLKLTGRLKHRAGMYEFQTLTKKPDLCKQQLSSSRRVHCLKGYDGQIAWRMRSSDAPVTRMAPHEQLYYRLNAQMGSQLLYPFAEGKRIELINTVPWKGQICHQIRVDFKGKPIEITYLIDVSELYERRRTYRNLEDDTTLTVEFDDFRDVSGVPIAFRETHYRSGRWVSTMQIENVRMNAGVMPWMFDLPGGLAEVDMAAQP